MKISVCMATFNGQRYVREQIESILPQLRNDDELIIVDDCSVDKTLDILYSFNDQRIIILENTQNVGVIKNFEKSINVANGDIIFLCDQDDVWYPSKVSTVCKLIQNSNYGLIVSDATITDSKLNVISDSFFLNNHSGNGVLKNIIKNTYLGAGIAFKKELKDIIMPFPKKIPMHDVWIGLLSEIFSKSFFYSEQLIYYRRHHATVTSGKRNKLSLVIIWRVNLIISLIVRFLKVKILRTLNY